MLASTGYIYPVSPHRQAAKAWHYKLNVMSSLKLDQIDCFNTEDDKASCHMRARSCECFDLYKVLVPYEMAWTWQKSFVRTRKVLVKRDEDLCDTLIMLQHYPVYTLGTRSSEKFLKFDINNAPYGLYQTERGGEVTYHGPGQLVMYPILNLRHHTMDLHWYLRSLEEVVIRALARTFSIKASRIDGLTGVWVGNKKVCAVGIRVSGWITYHGLALNVTTDLAPFRHIVPCGVNDHKVGTLAELVRGSSKGKKVETEALLCAIHDSLLNEFSEVFQLSLQHKTIEKLVALR